MSKIEEGTKIACGVLTAVGELMAFIVKCFVECIQYLLTAAGGMIGFIAQNVKKVKKSVKDWMDSISNR